MALAPLFDLSLSVPRACGLASLLLGLMLPSGTLAAAEPVEAPIPLGARRWLFLDDRIVASMTGVERAVQTARKHSGNPILTATEPWEANIVRFPGSVLREDGRFRMWYGSPRGVGYAESKDGIHWRKPQLDVARFDGRKTNCVMLKSDPQAALPFFEELFGVVRDDREPDPARRYKMGYLAIQPGYKGPREDPFHRGQRRGLGVAASPDGIHWTSLDPFSSDAICDGGTNWMRHPETGRFILYGRTQKTLPEVQAAWSKEPWYPRWHWGRAVARIESADFLTWDYRDPATAPVVMTADLDDPPGTEIYAMTAFPYEGLTMGLVEYFHARPDTATLDYGLAVSHDTVRFDRIRGGPPFLALGSVGEWDRFMLVSANNPPILVGDDLRFYYGGYPFRHDPYSGADTGPTRGDIGFATIKRDRFVALQASFDGGEVLTKPLVLTGNGLRLNVESDAGEVRVEVLAPDGSTVAASRPIVADALDARVEWETGGLPVKGTPLRLRFRLKNARLFAVWSP